MNILTSQVSSTITETVQLKAVNSTDIAVKYRDTTGATAGSKLTTMSGLFFDLTDGYSEQIVPSSVRFVAGGRTYIDRNGVLYHSIDPATGSGTSGGQVLYGSGRVELTDWAIGASNTLALKSLLTQSDPQPVTFVTFRTPIIPIRPSSVTINATTVDGVQLTLTPNSNGEINTASAAGKFDYENGIGSISFGQKTQITSGNRAEIEAQPWYDVSMKYAEGGNTFIREPVFVVPETIRYSAIAYSYLPLSADILGLDPVRLPSDGRVPIFRLGNVIVLHDTQADQIIDPQPDDVIDSGRVRLASARIVDSLGAAVDPSLYSFDLDAGTVTLGPDFAAGVLTPPFFVEHRIEDMAVVTDVQINGLLQLNRPITHDYPDTAQVSSAMIVGDMQARVFGKFSQQVWSNVWSDVLIGDATTAQYNDALYPLVTTNKGALAERWALIFTSSSGFRIVGEHVGQIGTGTINETVAPINPATNAPYFTIDPAGWGAGWAAGNVVRINTASANYPVWIARTVAAGPATTQDDTFSIQVRGDIDRP